MGILNKKEFEKLLLIEMEKQVKDGIESIIEKAKAEIEAKLRENVAHIALKMMRYYHIETRGDSLVIKVENQL